MGSSRGQSRKNQSGKNKRRKKQKKLRKKEKKKEKKDNGGKEDSKRMQDLEWKRGSNRIWREGQEICISYK